MFKKLLHEPLIHFLLIGGFIFFLYSFSSASAQDSNKDILISKEQIKQLSFRWEKKHFREPTTQELSQLIEQKIYEKIMVDEAIALGLDKNDLIINRRLMQKVEFISTDLVQLDEPTQEELLAYLKKHSKDFALESTISFKQLYFKTYQEAINFQKTLNTVDASTKKYTNNFMLKSMQTKRSKKEVSARFGKKFSDKIFNLKTNLWQEPLPSAYGFHLVYIMKKEENKTPSLDAIRAIVKSEYLNKKREELNQKFYQDLRKNYTIKTQKPNE